MARRTGARPFAASGASATGMRDAAVAATVAGLAVSVRAGRVTAGATAAGVAVA
ncbi:MAG: hypothetical protein U1E14_11975 [Geminicoccaceae bacterium]